MEQILIDNILQIIGGAIIGGILVGMIIENVRLKHSLKIEKIKRLAPDLEACCPIVEKIYEDSAYAIKILNRGQDEGHALDSQNQKVLDGLKLFQDWYMLFQEKGMKYELESVNIELNDRLAGLFTYARLSIKHGISYVSQNLKQINESAHVGNEKLKVVLQL